MTHVIQADLLLGASEPRLLPICFGCGIMEIEPGIFVNFATE